MTELDAVKEILKSTEHDTLYVTKVEALARKIIRVERKNFYGDKARSPLGDIRELIAKGVKNAD